MTYESQGCGSAALFHCFTVSLFHLHSFHNTTDFSKADYSEILGSMFSNSKHTFIEWNIVIKKQSVSGEGRYICFYGKSL